MSVLSTRLAREAMMAFSSSGLRGIRISVTSKRPSSRRTSFPVIPLKPPIEVELVIIPYMNSSSIRSPSCSTSIE